MYEMPILRQFKVIQKKGPVQFFLKATKSGKNFGAKLRHFYDHYKHKSKNIKQTPANKVIYSTI